MASQDIQDACDLFAPVWDGGHGRDGYVSLEVDPGLAYDSLRTYREAAHLHDLIDRPNLLVKIPATKPGLAAIEDAIAHGISINVTLIFSLQRYAEVAESYVRGLERLVAEGEDPVRSRLCASFFISRIDVETDRRLDEIGGHDHLKGKLAIANARLAYQEYKQLFSGPRWEYLTSKGATPQRVLWASTSTKNPDYPDTLYVEQLIGPDTVNTMPEETIEQYHDHGHPEPRVQTGPRRSPDPHRAARRRRCELPRHHRNPRARRRRKVRRRVPRAPQRPQPEAPLARLSELNNAQES